MQIACEMMGLRTEVNQISGIFLLSDGYDSSSKRLIDKVLAQNKAFDAITIHTFGFGEHHDSNLLSKIADKGDGNYFFIEKENQIGECFADSLGALMSSIVKNI